MHMLANNTFCIYPLSKNSLKDIQISILNLPLKERSSHRLL